VVGTPHIPLVTTSQTINLSGGDPLIVVDNPTDTPVASKTDLRQAIAQANTNGGAETIEFDTTVFSTSQTITLDPALGQLELKDTTGPETIIGPSAGVTVSGGGLSRVFQVDAMVTASISGLTITGGKASYGGGGVNNYGALALTNCTVSGNTASIGGGVLDFKGGTSTLTNCTISGNSASYWGGGLYTFFDGTAALTKCTVSGNSAGGGGGGVYSGYGASSAIKLANTIVAGNTSGYNPDVSTFGGGVFISQGNNLVGTTGNTSGWVGSDLTGTSVQPLNAVLAPLGNYGGPTQTMALLPGSPAIGAGSKALVPAGVTTDQRGEPRFLNGKVDIGAFQSSGFTIAYTSGSGQSASGAFAAPLVATVTANNPIEPVAGGLVTFTAPASGASATLSGNPAVLSASGTASVTAASNFIGGSYTVSATAAGAPGAASFSLTNYAVASIAISPGNPSLAVGVSGQFTATGTFTDGSTQNITNAVAWASGTLAVATIGGTGVASGVAVGSSKITATLTGVTSPADTLTVIAPSFVVTTTADAFGFFSGTTSIREAIAGANVVPGQTITFAKNVFQTPQTITLTLGQLELSDTTGTTTITAPNAGVTINGGGLSRVFQVDKLVTLSISGLTISGGKSASNGGGMQDYGTLTVMSCDFAGNQCGGGGGAIEVFGPTVTITNSSFIGNTAGYGGAIDTEAGTLNVTGSTFENNQGGNGGALSLGSITTLTNCSFVDNQAGGGGGGAIANFSPLTVTNCAFTGNTTSSYGGAILNYVNPLAISNSTFLGNQAVGTGGAIAINGFEFANSIATISNCTLSGNSTGGDGGAIFDGALFGGASRSTLTISGSTLSGNFARNGGGIYIVSGISATVSGSTLTGNSATGAGGGIANQGTLNVASSNIIKNQATSAGGGISTTGGSATITNSTVNANQVNSPATALGGGIDCENSVLSLNNCTVNANHANGENAYGGGIYALNSNVSVQNSNVNGNKAVGVVLGEGGGIYSYGLDSILTLLASNVNGNKATTAYDDIFSAL